MGGRGKGAFVPPWKLVPSPILRVAILVTCRAWFGASLSLRKSLNMRKTVCNVEECNFLVYSLCR